MLCISQQAYSRQLFWKTIPSNPSNINATGNWNIGSVNSGVAPLIVLNDDTLNFNAITTDIYFDGGGVMGTVNINSPGRIIVFNNSEYLSFGSISDNSGSFRINNATIKFTKSSSSPSIPRSIFFNTGGGTIAQSNNNSTFQFINGVNYTLTSALNCAPLNVIFSDSTAINFSNQTLNVRTITFSSVSQPMVSCNFQNTIVNGTLTNNYIQFQYSFSGTNFNFSGSQINMDLVSFFNQNFPLGLNLHHVTTKRIELATNTSTPTNLSINNLIINQPEFQFTNNGNSSIETITINTLSINTGSIINLNRVNLNTNTISVPVGCINKTTFLSTGNPNTIQTNAPTNLPYTSFQGIHATGNGITTSGLDLGQNTGITFGVPVSTNYYWIGGTGNWNDPAHWSFSSGGSPNGSGCIPSMTDNVFFDANSFNAFPLDTVYIPSTTVAYFNNMDWSGSSFEGILKADGNSMSRGSLNLSDAAQTIGTGDFYWFGTAGHTINTGICAIPGTFYFNQTGNYTLVANGKIGTTEGIRHLKGTLDLNGFELETNNYKNAIFNLYDDGVQSLAQNRTLNLVNSKLIITGNESSHVGGSMAVDGYLFTMNATNSTFQFTNTASLHVTLSNTAAPVSVQFDKVESLMTNGELRVNKGNGNVPNLFFGIQTLDLKGNGSIFSNSADLAIHTIIMEAGKTMRIHSGFSLSNQIIINNASCGYTANFEPYYTNFGIVYTGIPPLTSSNISLKNCNFSHASPWTINNGVDLGNNTNVIINTSVTRNFYWVPSPSNNWSDCNNWSIGVDGGNPAVTNSGCCIPGPQDNVFFTANSFTAGDNVVNMDVNGECRDMNWTGSLFTPQWVGAGNIRINGNWILQNNMLAPRTGSTYLQSSTATTSISTFGVELHTDIFVTGSSVFNQQSDLFNHRDFKHLNAVWNTNNFRFRNGSFTGNSLGAINPVLNLGSSNMELIQLANYNANSFAASNAFQLNFNPGVKIIIYNPGYTYFSAGIPQNFPSILDTTNSTYYFSFITSFNLNSQKIELRRSTELNIVHLITDTLITYGGNTYSIANPNSKLQVDDTLINRASPCNLTTLQNKTSGVDFDFIHPDCQLFIPYMRLRDANVSTTTCGSVNMSVLGDDLGNNSNWTFTPVSSLNGFPQDTIDVYCSSFPYTISTTGFGSALSYSWQNGSTNPTFVAPGQGLYSVTATYGNGCSISDQVYLRLIDTVKPVITCPVNQTVNTNPGTCTYLINNAAFNAVASDQCGLNKTWYNITGASTLVDTTTTLFGTTLNQGTNSVLWQAIDHFGNVNTCSFTIQVIDNIAPTISCPGNMSAFTSASSCSANVTTPNPTVSDNCSVASLTWTITQGATTISSGTGNIGSHSFNLGTSVVTYTVTDAAGNFSTCSFNVVVTDNVNPTISCPSSITSFTSAGSCTASVNNPNPIVADNCSVALVSWTITHNSSVVNSGSGNMGTQTFNLGVSTVNYTVTDAAGNSSTCSYTVTITDNVAPTINCPSNVTANTSSTSCDASIAIPNVTFSDNCTVSSVTWVMSGATVGASASTGINQVGTQTFNSGTTTIQYTVRDAANNASSCNFTVTVTDATPPVAPSLPNVTGQCAATAPIPVATDNCTGFVNGTTSDPLTYTAQGTFVIHWTFTDAAGNVTTANQTVIIDNTLPPTPPVLGTIVAECSATVPVPVATTGCSGPVNGTTSDPLVYNTQGTYTVNWTFDDGMGNVVTSPQTVIIDDITNPVSPILSSITAECTVSLTAPTTTDNCSGTITGTTSDPIIYTAQGTYNVIWTFNDGNGNSASVIQTVTIQDVTPPVLSGCPSTINQNNDPGQCDATVTWTPPVATDNCVGSVLISSHNPGDIFPLGTTTVTYTLTDAGGNVVSCSFDVIIDENEAPQLLNCPSDITQGSQAGQCGASVTWTAPSATDNCPGVVLTSSHNSGDFFDVGTTTVTYTATDIAGNNVTCSFTVTVNDNELPVITNCPTNITQGNDNTMCGANVSWTPPTVSDNCPNHTITSNFNPGDFFPLGTTVVTYTITDESGNSTTCSFDVMINDVEAPLINGLSDLTVCEGSFPTWTETVTDNCPGVTYTSDYTSGSTFPLGNTTVTYTAMDAAGNISTQSFTVTVNPAFTIDVSSSPSSVVCAGDPVELYVINPPMNASFEWIFNSTLLGNGSAVNLTNSDASMNGTYTVMVTDQTGCIYNGSIDLVVDFCDLKIPEALTPNNDNDNDTWSIENLENYPNSKVQIVNRWGSIVFESNDYKNDWSGKSINQLNIGGDQLPEGTYFYVLQLGGETNSKLHGKVYTGYVYLKY